MRRLLLALASAVLIGSRALFGEERREPFRVQLFSLGAESSARDPREGASAFVSRLDGRPGLAALEEKPPRRAAWDDPPASGRPEARIALVAVHFGARTDWLAFGFEPLGEPVLAVRRPARQYDTQGLYPENIPPGDRQIDRNAGIELAADFGQAWTARAAATPTVTSVTLRVMDEEGPDSPTLAPAEREGLRALFAAAALRQGFQPQRGETDRTWILRAARQPDGYRLTLETGEPGERGFAIQAHAHRESLFGYLERLIRAATRWRGKGVLFMVLNPAGGRLVGWNDDRIFFDQNGTLEGWSVVEGQRIWVRPKPDRYTPLYGFLEVADGGALLFQYQPMFERLHFQTGVGTRGPAVSATWPWGLAFAPDDRLVAADGRELKAVWRKRNETLWTVRSPVDWSAGPLVHEGIVWAGHEAGELGAWRLADGSPLWRTTEVGRWRGPMRLEKDRLIAASIEGRLIALRPGDGAVLWRTDMADTLLIGGLGPTGEGDLVVADRSGRVAVLDGAKGVWKAEWIAGEPAAGFAVVTADRVAWSGRRGRVVWLSLPNLRPVGEVSLETSLRDGLLIAAEAPTEWPASDRLTVERRTLILATDDEGFVYGLPMP